MRTDQDAFYQAHLERVSRSFAFCIREVRLPARHWIGLAYILCRLVDTIEDSAWQSQQAQNEAFSFFKKCILGLCAPEDLKKWMDRFPTGLPDGEIQLLASAPSFFSDLHDLPKPAFDALKSSILNMTEGMAYMCEKFRQGSTFRLHSLAEVNQYCFFVAGVVGELLTEIFAQAISGWNVTPSILLNSFHFGLFLQKVNILKDQKDDEASGRYFVPSREDLRSSIVTHAKSAFVYLISIPEKETDIRIFCGWSLFLGLASLPYIDQAWNKGKSGKISRTEMARVLALVTAGINSNERLSKLFSSYLSVDDNGPLKVSEGNADWLKQIYRGKLPETDFSALGLC